MSPFFYPQTLAFLNDPRTSGATFSLAKGIPASFGSVPQINAVIAWGNAALLPCGRAGGRIAEPQDSPKVLSIELDSRDDVADHIWLRIRCDGPRSNTSTLPPPNSGQSS